MANYEETQSVYHPSYGALTFYVSERPKSSTGWVFYTTAALPHLLLCYSQGDKTFNVSKNDNTMFGGWERTASLAFDSYVDATLAKIALLQDTLRLVPEDEREPEDGSIFLMRRKLNDGRFFEGLTYMAPTLRGAVARVNVQEAIVKVRPCTVREATLWISKHKAREDFVSVFASQEDAKNFRAENEKYGTPMPYEVVETV